jgi:catechol 2,3-dioxygenase-like lactoylglutathione lyase family enzyme
MTITFDMIGITVADMSTSLAFYRLLGLDISASADAEDHVEITLPNGLRFGWDLLDMIKTFDTEWTQPQGSPRVGLAFLCSDADEVNRRHAELVAAGYESYKEPWDAFWGQRYAIMHDPDGNGVDLFAPLPSTD